MTAGIDKHIEQNKASYAKLTPSAKGEGNIKNVAITTGIEDNIIVPMLFGKALSKHLPFLLKYLPSLYSGLKPSIMSLGIILYEKIKTKIAVAKPLIGKEEIMAIDNKVIKKVSKFHLLSFLKICFLNLPNLSPISSLKHYFTYIISYFGFSFKIFLLSITLIKAAYGETLQAASNKSSLVKVTASNIERKYAIPRRLLFSIAKCESGLNPYAVNYKGKGYYFKSKIEAVGFVQSLLNQGELNFDVGVAQINWFYHRHKFTSIDEAFDLSANLEYAAKFLTSLKASHGTWNKAIKFYHSSNEHYQKLYASKIISFWVNFS